MNELTLKNAHTLHMYKKMDTWTQIRIQMFLINSSLTVLPYYSFKKKTFDSILKGFTSYLT